MRLAGKIGIVTAAASGMGRAGALRFAREGAQVAVVDVDAAGVQRVVDEITAAGGTAHGIAADLTKDEDSRRIVWDTVRRFKGLDFVWNHVGHPGPAAVEGIDMNNFDLAVDLNLRTVVITTEAAIPEIRARDGRLTPQRDARRRPFTAALNGQERLGPIRRQVGVERVDEQRQQAVVPHDQRELDHSLAAELLERGLERPTAHATSAKEFATVVHHRRLVGSESWKLFAVAQRVDDL